MMTVFGTLSVFSGRNTGIGKMTVLIEAGSCKQMEMHDVIGIGIRGRYHGTCMHFFRTVGNDEDL